MTCVHSSDRSCKVHTRLQQCPDCVAFVQNVATTLLTQSLFLRDGVDENMSSSLCTDFI